MCVQKDILILCIINVHTSEVLFAVLDLVFVSSSLALLSIFPQLPLCYL